ncbi:hypothetical protein BsWGS_25360 [Bradybaena similaris]
MGLVLTTVAVSPVSLRLYDKSNNWIHVNFYEDDFLKFYTCMWTSNSRSCTADLTRDVKHPNETDNLRVMSVDKPDTLHVYRAYSSVFACNTSLSLKQPQLVCTRLPADSSLCGNHMQTVYFHFFNESTENSRCVGIRFSFVNESLLYDSNSDGIDICNISCNATNENRSSSKPNHHTVILRHPGWSASTEDTLWNDTTGDHRHVSRDPEHHHRNDNDDDKEHSHDKSHIIIAAVVSIVVLSGLITAAFFFRRQILAMRRKANANDDYISRNPTIEVANNKTNGHQERRTSTHENSRHYTDQSLSIE